MTYLTHVLIKNILDAIYYRSYTFSYRVPKYSDECKIVGGTYKKEGVTRRSAIEKILPRTKFDVNRILLKLQVGVTP